jgi:hypothetical protein
MIEQHAATERAQAKRCAQLQAEIRLADHLDKAWPVVNLVDALHLLTVARARLLTHLEQQHKTEMSLREFMDLVISEHTDAADLFSRTPLLRVRGVGKYGFYSVAAELSETDVGPRGKAEWQRRLAVLRRKWRVPSWPPNPRRRDG